MKITCVRLTLQNIIMKITCVRPTLQNIYIENHMCQTYFTKYL